MIFNQLWLNQSHVRVFIQYTASYAKDVTS